MELRFAKYEGLGNDFVVIEAAEASWLTSELTARLCDRHFGLGADGVLLVLPSSQAGDADVTMEVHNFDGSVPEMCGNGIRCVVHHLARTRPPRETWRVSTKTRVTVCHVRNADGSDVEVDMGRVIVDDEEAIEVNDDRLRFFPVSVGNPHAVFFEQGAAQAAEILGPLLEMHPRFPDRTNVEFVTKQGDEWVTHVWERGVGITLACGSGACAVAEAAWKSGRARAGEALTVRLPGGKLALRRGDDGHVWMRGPARFVFEGRFDLSRL